MLREPPPPPYPFAGHSNQVACSRVIHPSLIQAPSLPPFLPDRSRVKKSCCCRPALPRLFESEEKFAARAWRRSITSISASFSLHEQDRESERESDRDCQTLRDEMWSSR